jgi:hypothetical protein
VEINMFRFLRVVGYVFHGLLVLGHVGRIFEPPPPSLPADLVFEHAAPKTYPDDDYDPAEEEAP